MIQTEGIKKFYFGETVYAETFIVNGTSIQLIKINYGEPEQVVSQFDFENSKAILMLNFETNTIEMLASPLLYILQKERKIAYRRQTNLDFSNKKEEEKYARKNIIRLIDKYYLFGEKFYDEDSQEHFWQQFSWCLFIKKTNDFFRDRIAENILINAICNKNITEEQAVIFVMINQIYREIYYKHFLNRELNK